MHNAAEVIACGADAVLPVQTVAGHENVAGPFCLEKAMGATGGYAFKVLSGSHGVLGPIDPVGGDQHRVHSSHGEHAIGESGPKPNRVRKGNWRFPAQRPILAIGRGINPRLTGKMIIAGRDINAVAIDKSHITRKEIRDASREGLSVAGPPKGIGEQQISAVQISSLYAPAARSAGDMEDRPVQAVGGEKHLAGLDGDEPLKTTDDDVMVDQSREIALVCPGQAIA